MHVESMAAVGYLHRQHLFGGTCRPPLIRTGNVAQSVVMTIPCMIASGVDGVVVLCEHTGCHTPSGKEKRD